jgi:hypothetical protein
MMMSVISDVEEIVSAEGGAREYMMCSFTMLGMLMLDVGATVDDAAQVVSFHWYVFSDVEKLVSAVGHLGQSASGETYGSASFVRCMTSVGDSACRVDWLERLVDVDGFLTVMLRVPNNCWSPTVREKCVIMGTIPNWYGVVTWANAYERIVAMPPEQMVGLALANVVDPPDASSPNVLHQEFAKWLWEQYCQRNIVDPLMFCTTVLMDYARCGRRDVVLAWLSDMSYLYKAYRRTLNYGVRFSGSETLVSLARSFQGVSMSGVAGMQFMKAAIRIYIVGQ